MHSASYLALGRVHPPQPVSYVQAHRRVRDERGPASAHVCEGCGEAAAEWSYSGFSPDEQISFVGDPGAETLRAWSPVPADYSPLCRECHWRFDEEGVICADGPTPRLGTYSASSARRSADERLRALADEPVAPRRRPRAPRRRPRPHERLDRAGAPSLTPSALPALTLHTERTAA